MNPQDRPHLPQDEEQLLQYLDGQLPAPEARAVEAHLAVCPECRTLRRQWEELDERLTHTLAQPRLSADFARRLRHRVAEEAQANAQTDRLRGLEGTLGRATPGFTEPRRRGSGELWLGLLDVLGYGAAAAVGGYGLLHLAAAWVPDLASTGAAFLRSPAFLSAMVPAVAALALGLNLAARNKVSRWLQAF